MVTLGDTCSVYVALCVYTSREEVGCHLGHHCAHYGQVHDGELAEKKVHGGVQAPVSLGEQEEEDVAGQGCNRGQKDPTPIRGFSA